MACGRKYFLYLSLHSRAVATCERRYSTVCLQGPDRCPWWMMKYCCFNTCSDLFAKWQTEKVAVCLPCCSLMSTISLHTVGLFSFTNCRMPRKEWLKKEKVKGATAGSPGEQLSALLDKAAIEGGWGDRMVRVNWVMLTVPPFPLILLRYLKSYPWFILSTQSGLVELNQAWSCIS